MTALTLCDADRKNASKWRSTGENNMPYYEYRCQSCRTVFGEDRSMHEKSDPVCNSCGSNAVARIWNAFIRAGGITPDVGQGASKLSAGASSGGGGGGCGSCSSHSCGTCH
jgi:putative FmdB family regulatory protein